MVVDRENANGAPIRAWTSAHSSPLAKEPKTAAASAPYRKQWSLGRVNSTSVPAPISLQISSLRADLAERARAFPANRNVRLVPSCRCFGSMPFPSSRTRSRRSRSAVGNFRFDLACLCMAGTHFAAPHAQCGKCRRGGSDGGPAASPLPKRGTLPDGCRHRGRQRVLHPTPSRRGPVRW